MEENSTRINQNIGEYVKQEGKDYQLWREAGLTLDDQENVNGYQRLYHTLESANKKTSEEQRSNEPRCVQGKETVRVAKEKTTRSTNISSKQKMIFHVSKLVQ